MAFVLVCRATLAVSAINDADPTCVGDCDDNGTVTVGELLTG